jgi:ribosome-associated protein
MPRIDDHLTIDDAELTFRTSRAGGPGGQHVNRTESRVEVRFDVARSPSLTDAQRARLLTALRSRLTGDGELVVVSQDERSQLRNKEIAVARLCAILARALHVDAPRRPTRPTRASKLRRLDGKTKRSNVKRMRGKVED